VNGHLVALHQEALALGLVGRPSRDVAFVELGHRAAGRADQVVVMSASAEPVDHLSPRPGDGVHRAAVHQQRHGALGGALAQAGRAAAPAGEEHRQRQGLAGVAQGVQDRLALGCPAQSVGAQAAPHRLCPRALHAAR
jgi:hypothetical protein